jgi:hypothetical protein
MAGDAKKLQPIIIKRVKKGGHAAHGGAWKIAYADFVTAMMAFFLLMWLLGSTTEGDKKGISDYFQSPLKVALQGGAGAGASNSIITGGGNDLTQSAGQSKRGEGTDSKAKKSAGDQRKIERAKKDAQTLAAVAAKIASSISSNPRMAEFSSQIKLEITPDGENMRVLKWMIDRLEGKAAGVETGFGVAPAYSEINWTGLDFSQAQFDSVTSLSKDDWKAEIALHTELFSQLAYHLPKELEETKTQLAQRLAA